MFWYYLSRSSLVTFLIIVTWAIANIFVNVPPDFNQYKGDVIHTEIVKKDECREHKNCTVQTLNITYLTKSGHSVNVTDTYCPKSYNYDNIVKKHEYYETSHAYITIFVLLCLFGGLGTFITFIGDGIDDIDQMLYGDQTVMIHARDMRFNHYKLIYDFFGYKDEETRQLVYKAIEMERNSSQYQRCIEYGYKIRVPSMTAIDEAVENNVKLLIKEKQQKETNITNG